MICRKDHRYDDKFRDLPYDQGDPGRHHCAGCAYDAGYDDGRNLREQLTIRLNELPSSQAGTVRHKSAHAGFALGYLHGVRATYPD